VNHAQKEQDEESSFRLLRVLRACGALWQISVQRLLWSTSALMLIFPLTACALFLWRFQYVKPGVAVSVAFRNFSLEFVLGVFSLFILPITALAFATTSLGSEREDRTLVYLLIRPIPRYLILFVKYAAALPVILLVICGSFWIFCRLAGEVGTLAWNVYLIPLLVMAAAYTGLFHLFSVWFRHAAIVALVYALFIEFFLGNMPGIIKRVAVSFYGRSWMFELGKAQGLTLPREELFDPVSGEVGLWTLAGIAVGSLLLAMLSFQYREYQDLT